MLRKLQNVPILTRAKIYTLNPTLFRLTYIYGGFDELELRDVLVAKRNEPTMVLVLPAKIQRQFRNLIHRERLATYHLNTRATLQGDSLPCALRQ